MPTLNSALSSYFMCLAITYGTSLAIETGSADENPDGNKTSPEATIFSSSPIKPRILDATDHRTNETYVTIRNDFDVEESSQKSIEVSTRCPPLSKIDFKPSPHIGEIDEHETRKSGDMDEDRFKRMKQRQFGGTVATDEPIDTDRARLSVSSFGGNERSAGSIAQTKIPVKFFETDGRYGVTIPVGVHQHSQHHDYHELHQVQFPGQQMSDDNDGVNTDNDNNRYQADNTDNAQDQEAIVTLDYPRSPVTSNPVVTFVRPRYPATLKNPLSVLYEHQHYVPSDDVYSIHGKPSKLHDDTVTPLPNVVQYQFYEYSPIANTGNIKKPDVHSFYHQTGSYAGQAHQQTGNHQADHFQSAFPQEHTSEQIGKPETLLYVTSHRESAVTRMRKFPYQFYEPSVVGHQDQYHYGLQEIPFTFPPKEHRVSPWKKIFHLIGAFLPLGLLLATLKPNVVKIENTTQPNIVLSKLRVVDLPAEHKRGELADLREAKFQDTCDDRFICELIVSGSEPSSNLLHNVLWNLTNKSTEEEVRKNGLYEIFSAAKRKDCSSIDC